MDTLNNYGAILAFGTLLITGLAYFYAVGKKGRADIIRQDNADLRASNQELRSEKAGYVATIAQQTDTIKNLREVATQTPAVTQLIEITTKQQNITNKQHTEVIKAIANLAEKMSLMTTEFSQVAKAMINNTTAQEKSLSSRENGTK